MRFRRRCRPIKDLLCTTGITRNVFLNRPPAVYTRLLRWSKTSRYITTSFRIKRIFLYNKYINLVIFKLEYYIIYVTTRRTVFLIPKSGPSCLSRTNMCNAVEPTMVWVTLGQVRLYRPIIRCTDLRGEESVWGGGAEIRFKFRISSIRGMRLQYKCLFSLKSAMVVTCRAMFEMIRRKVITVLMPYIKIKYKYCG